MQVACNVVVSIKSRSGFYSQPAFFCFGLATTIFLFLIHNFGLHAYRIFVDVVEQLLNQVCIQV